MIFDDLAMALSLMSVFGMLRYGEMSFDSLSFKVETSTHKLSSVSVAEWSKACDSSSHGEIRAGSNPAADIFNELIIKFLISLDEIYSFEKTREEMAYNSRFVRVILAQG